MSKTQDIEELILWKLTESERLLTVNPVLRCLVDGICDKNCVLSMLLGTSHILQEIWNIVIQYWKALIENVDVDDVGNTFDEVFFHQLYGEWRFPKPSNLCINMMPFVMERTFAKCKLPDYLEPYWNKLINTKHCEGLYWCNLIPDDEIGKIGFLSIHESYVDENKTQQRGGIHTESPGILTITKDGEYFCMGRVSKRETSQIVDDIDYRFGAVGDGHSITKRIGWALGGSHKETEFNGGIYVASNVSNSCEVWNCKISPDENGDEIIGSLGDLEHLREFLPKGRKMEANQMYWLTDRTPHKLLPLETGMYRQYFQLVTSEVSVWFEEHSTKNPLGVVPDPERTIIVKRFKTWE